MRRTRGTQGCGASGSPGLLRALQGTRRVPEVKRSKDREADPVQLV
jgi:hypothetical protein